MSENNDSTIIKNEVDCLGNFNPRDGLCSRKCSLAMRCIIEYNRRTRLEEFMDLLEFEDIGPADLH